MKKYAVLAALLYVVTAAPARAQLLGMPVWNDPNAGTGVTISGDVGFPEADEFGTVYAGRGNFGLGGLHLGATVGVHDPEGGESVPSLGGTLAFRVIGGMALPVSVNAQAGFSTEDPDDGRYTRVTAAVGIGASAPVPGVDLSAWVSPGLRFLRHPSGVDDSETNTNFGIAAGASLGFGLFGVHLGVDHENVGSDANETTFGAGIHLSLSPSLGVAP